MSTLASTIVICLAILFAPLFWMWTKKIFIRTLAPESWQIPTPYELTRNYLSYPYRDLIAQLRGKNFNRSNFPKKVTFSTMHEGYAEVALPIICVEIERAGWRVFKDDQCAHNEIMIDLPRTEVTLHTAPAC